MVFEEGEHIINAAVQDIMKWQEDLSEAPGWSWNPAPALSCIPPCLPPVGSCELIS